MFAILNDKDGKLISKVKLNNFTRKCGLWQAVNLSLAKLATERFKDGSKKRLIDNLRTFIVFNEREEKLLNVLGETLGFPCLYDEVPEVSYRPRVKAVLSLFIEDIKIAYFKPQDHVEPTYYPLGDGRCLPAYGIVRSNFIEEGGLSTDRE